jgi:hypothetical protein
VTLCLISEQARRNCGDPEILESSSSSARPLETSAESLLLELSDSDDQDSNQEFKVPGSPSFPDLGLTTVVVERK